MKNLITTIALALSVCLTASATNFSGGVYNNTTWTTANSPYIITGDVVVFESATLTIDPGVEVLVDSNLKIEVRGRLHVKGTEEHHVTIRGNTGSGYWAFWRGIIFIGNNPGGKTLQADFKYCDFSNAREALNFDIACHGPYNFRYCNFTNNEYVNDDGGMGGMLFDHCTFKYSRTALRGFQFGGTVSNSVFDYNEIGIDGVEKVINCKFTNHSYVAMIPYGHVEGCEITNNNKGVKTMLNSVNNTFINNVVMDNGTGIEVVTCFNQHNFKNNKICNNTYHNIVLSTKNDCNLGNNCWCTTDPAQIRSMIHDGYVDVTRGLVSFAPAMAACHITEVPKDPDAELMAVELYPNPVRGGSTFRLKTDNSSTIEHVRVMDMLGKTAKYSTTRLAYNLTSVTLHDAAKGIYLVNIELNNGKSKTERVIVD